MIPKIIHYCWFGGNPLSELTVKCIESWQKYCVGYQIMQWNEDNFDVNSNVYVKEAYEAKKYAFVSDYVRLQALYKYGGIYFDTDVELIKPFDELLIFDAVIGFELENRLATCVIAAREEHELLTLILSHYDNRHFKLQDGSYDMSTNNILITGIFVSCGLELNNKRQEVRGFTVFPIEYFSPIHVETRIGNVTKNTYAIHHFAASWHNKNTKVRIKINHVLFSFTDHLFGQKAVKRLLTLEERVLKFAMRLLKK